MANDGIDLLKGISYEGEGSSGCDVIDRYNAALTGKEYAAATIERCNRIMDAALVVLYGHDGRSGIRKAMSGKHADVVCAHYLQLESWRSIARQLGCSEGWCRMLSKEVMHYIDTKARWMIM